MANISISLKKYKADYSRFLHNAKMLRLTFQMPAQRNDNPTWACKNPRLRKNYFRPRIEDIASSILKSLMSTLGPALSEVSFEQEKKRYLC